MLERVDLCPLISEQARFYEELAREKGIRLEVECSAEKAVVLGRLDGLRTLVTNLLSNALKYTPSGGKVSLKLAVEPRNLVLEVADTGIGIPEAEQPNLFREFFRAANARATAEIGTGLGLAIVRSIVQQHGGSIAVQSAEGRGTAFTVRLPRVEG